MSLETFLGYLALCVATTALVLILAFRASTGEWPGLDLIGYFFIL